MSERIAQTVDIDNCKAVIDSIVSDYCLDRNIEENDIKPAMWNDIIDEIHEVVFANNRQLLRDYPTRYNEYNQDKVLYIYKLYRRLCNSHCQEITLKGFTDLTGIDKQTIYNWKDNSNNSGNSEISSTLRFDLHEKIMEDNEQSLEAMLHDRSINPMKVLPSLNKKHGWNLPGVTRETSRNTLKGASELPKLGNMGATVGNIAQQNQGLLDVVD